MGSEKREERWMTAIFLAWVSSIWWHHQWKRTLGECTRLFACCLLPERTKVGLHKYWPCHHEDKQIRRVNQGPGESRKDKMKRARLVYRSSPEGSKLLPEMDCLFCFSPNEWYYSNLSVWSMSTSSKNVESENSALVWKSGFWVLGIRGTRNMGRSIDWISGESIERGSKTTRYPQTCPMAEWHLGPEFRDCEDRVSVVWCNREKSVYLGNMTWICHTPSMMPLDWFAKHHCSCYVNMHVI